MKKIIFSISLLLMFSNAYSYNSNSILFLKKSIVEITDTTKHCTLTTISKSKYTDIYMYGLSDSSVKISNDEYSKEILIKDIKSITFKGKGFWKGAAIGGGVGFVLGFIAGALVSAEIDEGSNHPVFGPGAAVGAVFAVPFGLIGGWIGSSSASDKIYDLSKLDFEEKRKKVKNIIKKYSIR